MGAVRPAAADVTLMLEEPINLVGRFTSTGHTSLWLRTICSDDLVHMRMCKEGEDGTVLSRYSGAAGYDWLAVPPVAYLYAQDAGQEPPAKVSLQQVSAMRSVYRAQHPASGTRPVGDDVWEQLLGESYRRTILFVTVRTTREQDLRLLAWLQTRRNKSHFNLLWNNCSDFSRQVMNVLLPGSVHRNLIFDAGMMTPEELVSSISRYAKRHPELGIEIRVLPQVPGAYRRSGRMYGTTESFVKTKPYLLPLTVLNPLEFGLVIATGLADRRFDVQQHVKTAPLLELPLKSSAAAEAAAEQDMTAELRETATVHMPPLQ